MKVRQKQISEVLQDVVEAVGCVLELVCVGQRVPAAVPWCWALAGARQLWVL